MTKSLSVSVAMTTYNGIKYVGSQIESILIQLDEDDQLIIADDGSTDGTFKIIEEFAKEDERVRVIQGEQLGIIGNFERAIRECTNDLIFLSDQDDVWLPNKVEVIKGYFLKETDLILVMSDLIVVDENLKTINESYLRVRGCSTGIVKNIVKNSYVGCALTYRKQLNEIILPFPAKIPMHDSWIGILAEVIGKTKMIEDKLVLYRRYDDNVTSLVSSSSSLQKVTWRLRLCGHLLIRWLEGRKININIL